MGSATQGLVTQMRAILDQAMEDKRLAISFKNMHQGYPDETVERFLRAREYNVPKANKMLLDCLHWRISNDIDNILARPIVPKETNDAIRETQLIGMTGFCKKGRPVFALAVGNNGYDKAPVDKYVQSHIQINEYRDRVLLPETSKRVDHYIGSCLKILDMTGLKLSALNRIKTLTIISTVDDLNYPEKTDTYYIVNAPYIFSACWKVVKPLLQERTKRKVQVLQGCGREELLKVMEYDVLPYFCRYDSKNKSPAASSPDLVAMSENRLDCFSPFHPFHIELYSYMKRQACVQKCLGPAPQKSFHVEVPEPDEEVHTIETAIETALENFSEDGTSEPVMNGTSEPLMNGTSTSKMKESDD